MISEDLVKEVRAAPVVGGGLFGQVDDGPRDWPPLRTGAAR